jgi:hypothetical protein
MGQYGYADGKSVWEQKGVRRSNKPRWDSGSFIGGGILSRPGPNALNYTQKLSNSKYNEWEENRKKLAGITSAQKEKSNVDQMMEYNFNPDPIANAHSNAPSYGPGNEPDPGDGTNWWDKVGSMLGSDGALGGIKGWLDLGVKGLNAWSGYKQVGLAEEQNQLGREAFGFQKAAWNKDYNARKIAYNTNARDVNAWKAAQTPGGYTMSELVV